MGGQQGTRGFQTALGSVVRYTSSGGMRRDAQNFTFGVLEIRVSVLRGGVRGGRETQRAGRSRLWPYPVLTLGFYIWRQLGRPSADWSLIR